MASMTVTMELVGIRAGKTIKLGAHQFVEGRLVLTGQAQALAPAINYLRTYEAFVVGTPEHERAKANYRLALGDEAPAFDTTKASLSELTLKWLELAGKDPAEFRAELIAEIERLMDGKDEDHGDSGDVPAPKESGPADEVRADVESAGPETASAEDEDGHADAPSGSGDAGTGADRDGHADAGVPEQQTAEDSVGGGPETARRLQVRSAVMLLDPDVNEHWTGSGKPAMEALTKQPGLEDVTRKEVNGAVGDYDRDEATAQKALKE